MATIVLSSYVIRYPVGGILSSNLQFLSGFLRLGHEVFLVESSGWANACFDPYRHTLSDDPTTGIAALSATLEKERLPLAWAFVDLNGGVYGLEPAELATVFERADLFIDRGLHGTFAEETAHIPVRVMMDPDPGYRQIQMSLKQEQGIDLPDFDYYYTYGHNIGTRRSPAPTASIDWCHLFHPVDVSRVESSVPPLDTPFTTVMNWRSLPPISYNGCSYGMKDTQFFLFSELPAKVGGPIEVAVEGDACDAGLLQDMGWIVSDAVEASRDIAAYRSFITQSFGEFSVLKEVYVALNVGWFSDRSALYLAHGRPVVVQDNGLEGHLPLGEGLFSVKDLDEAASAIDEIRREPQRHSRAARKIAESYLDTQVVLGRFLQELGLPREGAQ